ncbi:MAG: tetratricopeptide repeat protein [Rikenellaceae bacterium]|nr:tetratricopeptide repeat protein [Rikenellaceae bacterium]
MNRRNILAVVVCCILLSFVAQAQRPVSLPERPPIPDSLRATHLYIDALKALHSDSLGRERGERLFREVIAIDSMHAPSLYQLADLVVKRNPSEAEVFAERAYSMDSTDIWYAYMYGNALIANNKPEKALPLYEKVRDQEPSNASIYHMIGAIYYHMNMPYSAIQVLDSAELRAGLYGELHLQKCALLMETRQFDRARQEVVRYCNHAPYDIEAKLMLASMYEFLEQDSLQLKTLKEVLAIDPANADALTASYKIYRDAGNIQAFLATAIEAVRNPQISLDTKLQIVQSVVAEGKLCTLYFPQVSEMTNSMIAQYPDNYRVNEQHTVFLTNAGMMKEGYAKMKEYYVHHPQNNDALDFVLAFSLSMHEPIDSIRYYTQLNIDALPDKVEPVINQAQYLSFLNADYKECVKLYKRAFKMTENDTLLSEIQGYIADLYSEEKEIKQAYKHYEKSLQYNPDNALVLNNYSYLMQLNGGDLERAEEMALRAMKLAPTNHYYIDTYAWALFLRGKNEEALKYIKLAVSHNSGDNTVVWVHYGDILYAMGEKFMARIYWRRALDKGHDPDEIAQKLKQP